jgi:hypothetical protein
VTFSFFFTAVQKKRLTGTVLCNLSPFYYDKNKKGACGKEQYGISPSLCRSLTQKIKTKNKIFLHI